MLQQLKGIHKGERCFIIGTGPSLNKTDLSLLKNETCFGVNTLYRGLDKFGIKCKYWAISDDTIIKKHSKNIIENVEAILFSCPPSKSALEKKETDKCIEVHNLDYLGPMFDESRFSDDLTKGCFNGNTVIIDVCLQAAYYMGFAKVYLLGCDCDYSGDHRFDGSGSDVKTSPAIEGNFSIIFRAYEICKKVYELNNREIINCTVGGKLEIFKRQNLIEVFL